MRNLQGGMANKANMATTYRNRASTTSWEWTSRPCHRAPSDPRAPPTSRLHTAIRRPASPTTASRPPSPTSARSARQRGHHGPARRAGLNPFDLPGTHDHNVNLEPVSYGTTPARERSQLVRDYDNYDFVRHDRLLVDAGAGLDDISSNAKSRWSTSPAAACSATTSARTSTARRRTDPGRI